MRVGSHHSEESKAKLSAAGIGRPSWNKGIAMTDEAKAKLSAAHKGKKASPETLAKMSISRMGNTSHLGYKDSPETFLRKSAAQKGHAPSGPEHQTAETRAKQSAALMGNTHTLGYCPSAETRVLLSIASKGRKHSAESIAKVVAKISGSLNYNWKGGITPENVRLRRSIDYKTWRTFVFVRDHFTCQKCGKVGGRLEVHHIDGFGDFPEKRLDPENGITFCKDCHKEFNCRYGTKHNRKWQTDEFLSNEAELCQS